VTGYLVPVMGWSPLLAIAAACGTSLYVAKQFDRRR
jgi:hypothetical protein